MPKIPTFTSQARPTADVQSVKSNLQIPLSQTITQAVAPLTNFVVKKAVQENDTQNRTEALRLGNKFNQELNNIETETVNGSLGENLQLANESYTQKTNAIISKYKSEATNNFSRTMFENNALSAVRRGTFRIGTQIEKNINKTLILQVDQGVTSLMTQALYNDSSLNPVNEFGMSGEVNAFDAGTLTTNIAKLYTDAFSGRIPNASLNKMVSDIPSVVQGFKANKDIYSNPSVAYTELKKGENSLLYPDLKVEQRMKLIKTVETMMVQPLKKDFANVIVSLQDKGTEQPFDFNFARKIMKPEEYNQLITAYDIAKENAEDVRTINTIPTTEINAFIEDKNFNTDLYIGSADRLTQSKLQEGLINARDIRAKKMKADPVQFIIDTNSDIAEKTNNYRNEQDPTARLANRTILSNALIDEQIKMGSKSANLRILNKQEISQIKNTFLDTNIKSEEKINFIETLKNEHGINNYAMITSHLQDEKTPTTILMAMKTDSTELAKDLFNSSTLKELKTLINKAGDKNNSSTTIEKLILKKTEDFAQVIDSQGEGSESQAALMLAINEALLKVALVRMDKDTSAAEAVESASNDFLGSYTINDSLTWLIPKKINNTPVPTVAAQNKAEAILLGIKDTSEGNYLDSLMGNDGYAHYATMANIKGLTEEQIKEKVTFTIRNHSRWLNNSDMTGAVLYADFANGLQPVVNSSGQRVEYYFTNQPNQDPKIKATESVYPITGDVLPLTPDENPFGAIDYDPNLDNENLKINNNITSVSEEQFNKQLVEAKGMTANSGMIISDASTFVEFKNVDIVEIASYEGNELQGYVPDAKGSKSGVTIASGLDLGARSVDDLEGLPEDIITKLEPFLGLKGNEAVARAKELNITEEEAKIINTFAHKQSLTKLKKKWEKDSGQSFDLLSKEQATVLASVAFQYGDLKTKTPKFYKLALAGNWQGVYEELLNFKDRYGSRREKEAAYLKKYLDNN